jgi:hypothetical protein
MNDWNPPEPEIGYGQPHPPAGGEFSAEARTLITTADAWDGVATTLKDVWGLTNTGAGWWMLFGAHDTLYTAGRMHASINDIIVDAAQDGYVVTTGLADGLVETANDYEGTETTVGANFRAIERRAD